MYNDNAALSSVSVATSYPYTSMHGWAAPSTADAAHIAAESQRVGCTMTTTAARTRMFALRDVPAVPVLVHAHRLGSFRFKGAPQPVAMVNIMSGTLLGRTDLFPVDPPKGKGGRVAAATGLAGAAMAQLPTLAVQYRARMPDRCWRTSPHGGGGRHQLVKSLSMRTSSMPAVRRSSNSGIIRESSGSATSSVFLNRARSLLPVRSQAAAEAAAEAAPTGPSGATTASSMMHRGGSTTTDGIEPIAAAAAGGAGTAVGDAADATECAAAGPPAADPVPAGHGRSMPPRPQQGQLNSHTDPASIGDQLV